MFFSRSHQLTPPWFVQPLVITEKKHRPHNLNCLLLHLKAILLEVSKTAHHHLTLTVVGHSILACPASSHLQHLRESLTSLRKILLSTASPIFLMYTNSFPILFLVFSMQLDHCLHTPLPSKHSPTTPWTSSHPSFSPS